MIELAVQNYNGEIYEISEVVTGISWVDKLNDGCSKLEIRYLKNDKVTLKNGCIVRYIYDDNKVFYGKVFKWGKSHDKEMKATCYDQLRYAKTKDTIVLKNKKLGDAVQLMCTKLSLKSGIIEDTGYVLATSIQDDKTWLDIIASGISDTLVAKGTKYRLADEFGSITLRNLANLKTDLILGDESLAYSYEYECSIDDDTYNYIKVVSDNETTGKRDAYVAKNDASIKKYGMLMYYDKLDDNVPKAQAQERAKLLLSLYNRETETLKLDCLGDNRIRAGVSFYCAISELGIAYRVICSKVTHNYLPVHTMSLEVYMG